MRIVFFTHYFPPEGNAPASRTYDHCVRWIEKGAKVTVITCAPNVPNGVVYDGYKNRFWPKREIVGDIEVIRVWSFIAPNAGGVKRVINYVSYMLFAIFAFVFRCRRPDLVIATSPQFFCGWAGTISSIVKWCPFLLEIRDIWPESIIAVGAMKKGLATRFLEVLEKWMYKSANHIVAVGEGYKQAILKRAPKLTNISVVTNGVDLDKFQPRVADQEFLDAWKLNGKFVCAYVGTIGMAHGLRVVVEAAEMLRQKGRDDIKFCLVGDGANRVMLEKAVQEKGLQSYIAFTGRLPKEKMSSVMASSNTLLIHLRKCDLFTTVIPSKMFEAMAMGKPIIMGVDGEARDIVTTSGSGINMRPDEASDLVDAVCELASNPQQMQKLEQSGRPFVAANYTRDVLAGRMYSIIKSVATGQPVDNSDSPEADSVETDSPVPRPAIQKKPMERNH